MSELRQALRRPVQHRRPCWMNVISFNKMEQNEVIVKFVDMSPGGAGIEASDTVDPGFVWFPERIDGHRGGLLMWTKKLESLCRGGIQFVKLSAQDERAIEEKMAEQGPVKDIMTIAETIFRNRGAGYFIQTSP